MTPEVQEIIQNVVGIIIFISPAIALLLFFELRRYKKAEKIRKKEINANIMRDEFTEVQFMNERLWTEYKKLRFLASERNMIVCPKVSVLGLVEPRYFLKDAKNLRKRLSDQYIDFVVCTKHMKPLLLIRLLNNERMEGQAHLRDQYANAALGVCGYHVVNVWSIQDDILKDL